MGIKLSKLVSLALTSAALLTGWTFGMAQEKAATEPIAKKRASDVQSGVIKVGNASIEYFSQGSGEAVVLLPGGALDVGYMKGLAEALAKAGYRVVRVNPRGAGKSTGPKEGVTLHTLASDVAGVPSRAHGSRPRDRLPGET